MRIALADVRRGPVRWSEVVSPDDEGLELPEIVSLGPIETKGEVMAVDTDILVRGRLEYVQSLDCDRCLETTDSNLQTDFDYLVRTVEPGSPGAAESASSKSNASAEPDELELSGEQLTTLVVEDDTIDLMGLIQEQILLQVPMKPLCRPDCKGLCGQCGANLNEGSCSCAPPTDPRWAALADLKRN